MKAKNASLNFFFAGTLLCLLLAGSSCTKNNTKDQPQESDLSVLASQINGQIFTTQLASGEDKEGISFVYNNDKKLLLLEKESDARIAPESLTDAQVLCSEFGIIIRDRITNKTWCYVLQDQKHREAFESVKSFIPDNALYYSISGYMDIHINSSPA